MFETDLIYRYQRNQLYVNAEAGVLYDLLRGQKQR